MSTEQETPKILIGGSDAGQIFLDPKFANRHGLIAGATGTGKTVTLQCLAESFSAQGVPVFLADVKGDISCLLYTSPSPRDRTRYRMPSSA